ncbi:MAG: tyrosine-type recombinase/integrase [Candidatus Paceibacteria bacterium]
MKMTEPKLYTRGVKLWVRFSLNGEVIKRSLNIEDSKANRKLATTQIIPQMLLKMHSGEFFENKIVPTVKEMIDISLKMNRASRKANTHSSYNYVLNKHVVPVFGNRKIDSIKASELTLWQNNLLETLSNKAAINVRIIFNGIFEDALRDEIIQKNPFSIVKAPKNVAIKENIPFSKDEIFKILDASPDKIKLFFAIGFFTGMRTGEITALKWENIDLENKTISVKATRNKGIETTPKTKSSIRDVDILDVLIPYIENHLKYNIDESPYVFTSRLNKPYHSAIKISTTYWKKVLKELEIPYRNLYQMRHTFASMMIASGEDILWVSSMLGHKNANITLQVYAKYIKDEKKSRGTFLLN